MRLKVASITILALLLWLASLSPGIRPAPSARAEPIGGVDPVSGSLVQTFVFVYVGFEPYTQLTLSVLPPGYSEFIIIDPGVPVITDGLGQAFVPVNLIALLDDDPSGLPPELAQLLPLAGLVNVSWAYGPGEGFASFRFDACDTTNCVDLWGTLSTAQ